MRKILLCCMVIHQSVNADNLLSFIGDFDAFVATMVTQDERNNFKRYYDKLLKTIDEDAPEQQCSTRRYFRQKALDSLDTQHHAWYEQITTFLHDVAYVDPVYDHDRDKLQAYLVWYGAYQEFDSTKKQVKKQVAVTKTQVPEKHTALETTKSVVAQASTKVKGWFSFFSSSKSS